jgi:outer membrane protein OmpA-like peptidoglycan-associated protein
MKKLLTVIISVFGTTLSAQDFLGIQSSNYAGVLGVYSNAANIVDSRYVVDVSLLGFNTAVDNNYLAVKKETLKFKITTNPLNVQFRDSSWKKRNAGTGTIFGDNFTRKDNGKDKAGYMSSRVVLPSFMISLNQKNAIAFNWSFRNYINIDGISQALADLAFNDFSIPSLFDRPLRNKNLSMQQMAWMEYGLTYARVLKMEGRHFVKAGLTAKYLQGLEAVYIYVRELDYSISTKDTFSFFNTDVSYGHSESLDLVTGNGLTFDPSPGFGFDIGGVYEWRPNFHEYQYDMDGKTNLWRKDKNKYKLKVALAVNDIGGIRFRKGGLSSDFHANITDFDIGSFSSAGDINRFDSTVRSSFRLTPDEGTFFMMLPTSVNSQVDFDAGGGLYLNLSANFGNFFKKRESRVHEFTIVSFAPRLEGKWIGLTIPISYNTLAAQRKNGTSVGFALRAGPLVLGSNDIFNYLNKDIYGASFYAAVRVPILYTRVKDRDKDGVSNKKDLCKDVPGVWEFMGCPDRDKDHVQDKDDRCPDVAGLKEFMGCPDRDSDGIIDLEDACPDTAGLTKFKGCPDTDGDNVIDREDECPFVAGIAEFNGCPDTDKDGTPDKKDQCPELFGPKEYRGCPDKDGDKVIDKEDGCPELAGPVENKGCPWTDTDNDGIVDKDDQCPKVPGVPELKGCPVPKADPVAQEVPMKAAEKKIIEKAFASLEFATGKDVIMAKSLPALNDLAKLMIAHKEDWKLKLSGHTDNQGNAEKNMILSEKRTVAVQKYLRKKGVGEDQILTEWHGQEMPIADNKTPKGRQKNRRVEMKILLRE